MTSRLLRDIPRKYWGPVMAAARAVFKPKNRYGVLAFGVGPRIIRGRPSGRRVLNVYVTRKELEPRYPVPELTFSVGRATWKCMPNVVATGKKSRASLGRGPVFTGLHAGAAVAIRGSTPLHGAIACLLATNGSPTHALTAGHLFPPGAGGQAIFAAEAPGVPPRRAGTLVENYLDTSDVDAALLKLDAAGIAMINAEGPPLAEAIASTGQQRLVRAFLATANDFSRQVTMTGFPLDVTLSSPTRGIYRVSDAISTDGEITNPGDSGTILCGGASNEVAAGICAGAIGAHSIFVPFDRVMELAIGTAGALELF